MPKNNMTLLCDFYELTMANGYFELGKRDEIAYFDVFFRRIPDGGGFAIAAGLEQLIDYIHELKFTEEDIAFLRSKGVFSEEVLAYLVVSMVENSRGVKSSCASHEDLAFVF